MTTCTSDLLIIGGGPAGLSAAINGASEGLKVRLMDNGAALGGQARESAAIENLLGFPEGITGNDLMERAVRQAHRFDTGLICPTTAARLERLPDGSILVTADDYSEHVARAVLLAIGVQYRRLTATNLGLFLGRGVHYGLPSVPAKPVKKSEPCVVVVGGANSAGQAVVNLARDPRLAVKLLIRKNIEAQMSAYLIAKIRALPNVEVLEGCEVTACSGKSCLEQIVYVRDGSALNLSCSGLYIFIGAQPRTLWLKGSGVSLDPHWFIMEGASPYSTTLQGVFVAGDVRSGSTKRIASAVGEGAAALQMIHRYLEA